MKPLYARLVPFAAVCSANFINIPMMRSNELVNGTPVFTPSAQRVGNSKIAAATGIFLVCISRVCMALPGMTLVPMITNKLLDKCYFRGPYGNLALTSFQMSMVALCLTFATPLGCAFFAQKACISINRIEAPLKAKGPGKRRGKPLDASSAGTVIVAIFMGGLCPAVAAKQQSLSCNFIHTDSKRVRRLRDAKKIMAKQVTDKIDFNQPRWDQSTYMGRIKHFFYVTNPINFFASDEDLDHAKSIVDEYRKTKKLPAGYDAETFWAKKYLYDGAFHPDTGEKTFKIGRMNAQVPMNTLIAGCLVTFYKTRPAIIFWQWFNQSFNAVVNYSNRSGTAVISTKQVVLSYFAACGGALTTALYFNGKAKGMSPMFARLVPFTAVCCANFINIPMMRSSELMNGTPVFAPDGKKVGDSKITARKGIFLVCLSRVLMTLPGLTVVPIITNIAVERKLFCHYPMAVVPFQLALVCLSLVFTTPLGCATFSQRAEMSVDSIETEIKEALKKIAPKATTVYYNKGL